MGKRRGRLLFCSYRRIWTQNRKPQYIFDGLAPEQKPDYAEKLLLRAIWAIERVIRRLRQFWATWRVAQAEELAIFLAFKYPR